MNFSKMCTILVTFGPETSEFTLLTIAPFVAIRQKRHITPNISECPGPTLTYLHRFGRPRIGAEYYSNIHLPVAQGTLP